MAQTDYGGYVYKDEVRIDERSQTRPSELDQKRGTPDLGGFGSAAPGPSDSGLIQADHCVLGSGPSYLSLHDNHEAVVSRDNQQIVSIEAAHYDRPLLKVSHFQIAPPFGPGITIIGESAMNEDDGCIYARMREKSKHGGHTVWTGWSARKAGPGWSKSPERQAATEAYDARMKELFWSPMEGSWNTSLRWIRECKNCGAAGLTTSIHEGPGTAVVCSQCRGHGKELVTETLGPPYGTVMLPNIKRVFGCNPGIALTVDTPGGVDIDDWDYDRESAHTPGAEARHDTCPAWWFHFADRQRKPDWPECEPAPDFKNCRYFGDKAKCWKRHDDEQSAKQRENAPAGT